MSRIAGLTKSILPFAGYTALSYGLGKLSGQDDQRALSVAAPGVTGALLGEKIARKLSPLPELNIPVRGRKIPIHFDGIAGSLVGGAIGAGLGEYTDTQLRPNIQQPPANPYFTALDELAMPAISVARAFF